MGFCIITVTRTNPHNPRYTRPIRQSGTPRLPIRASIQLISHLSSCKERRTVRLLVEPISSAGLAMDQGTDKLPVCQ